MGEDVEEEVLPPLLKKLEKTKSKGVHGGVLSLASSLGLIDRRKALMAALILDLLTDLAVVPPFDPVIAAPLVFLITWLFLRKHYKNAKLLAVLAALVSALIVP